MRRRPGSVATESEPLPESTTDSGHPPGGTATEPEHPPARAATEPERPPANRILAIWPWLLVTAAAIWNLAEYRTTLLAVQYGDDSVMHEQLVRFASARISAGHDPLTSWFPYLNLGSPDLMHYQATPAILAGVAGQVIGPDAAFRWSLYLLWCLWPVAVYAAGRLFGLSRAAAALAGVVAPLLSSASGIGYEAHAYLWLGYGEWTQLWASWALPFAWALTWRAMTSRRFIAPAAALVALTAALHYETGYLAFLAVVIMPFLAVQDLRARLGRAAVTMAAALLASAWVIVPLLLYSRWAAINQALAGTPYVNGYGARTIATWLAAGQILDAGRLPVISLLALAGLVVAGFRWKGPERALVVLLAASLLLACGRTTFGGLASLVPGGTDVFFRRFLMGAQLSGIYLAGLGGAAIASAVARLAAGGRRALARNDVSWAGWLPAGVMVLASAAWLFPAWQSTSTMAARNAADIAIQRHAQAHSQATAVATAVRQHGGGRVYAGTPSNWGQHFMDGSVPLYMNLANLDIPEVGFTLRTASLMSQPEYHFDPANPGNYALFGIRYVIMPAGRSAPAPPHGAVLLRSSQQFRVFELPGNSYIRLGDTTGLVHASRANVGSQTAAYLRSALPGRDKYLSVAYAGAPAAPPTLPPRTAVTGSPGTVISQRTDLISGRAQAVVTARRRAVVILSASFDPGWTATVDGHLAATQMVSPALVAVPVPPGRHVVAFRYRGFGGYPELLALAVATLVAVAAVTCNWGRRRKLGGFNELGAGSGAAHSPSKREGQ